MHSVLHFLVGILRATFYHPELWNSRYILLAKAVSEHCDQPRRGCWEYFNKLLLTANPAPVCHATQWIIKSLWDTRPCWLVNVTCASEEFAACSCKVAEKNSWSNNLKSGGDSSEKSVTNYQSTLCHVSEKYNLHQQRHVNIKSRKRTSC
jgi:hypothetical protein